MADATTIREFLVALGFETKGKKEFENTVTQVTLKVVALGAAAAATAATITASAVSIANDLEKLYFASKRTGATVENLQAVGYAASQMGSDASAAMASVESLARLLRNSPGGEGLLKNIGIQTRDASGGLRDTVGMLGDLGEKFAKMPYYKANAYAQALGIDEKTLMAMREGLGQFSAEYKEALRISGNDSQDAAKKSHEFMVQVRATTAVFGLLMQKIAAGLVDRLGTSIERFRAGFLNNFGKIADSAVKVLLIVFKIGDAIGQMVVRGMQVINYLIDRFNGLSDGSQTIIKWLGLILLAWKALSTGFLATPLGRVIALISALGLLWDDYQTWKEGGKSLIDWSEWAPGIEKAIEAIKWIGNAIHESLGFLGDWRGAFEIFLAYVTGSWLLGMLGAIGKVSVAAAGAASSLLGKAVPVAAAGVGGYAAGSYLYENYLKGTDAADTIGGSINGALNLFGLGYSPEANKKAAPSAPANRAAKGNQPRGIRNNNPGNIEYGNFARQQGSGGAESAGRFATFNTPQEGLNALAALLRSYGNRGIDSVRAIISKYAPSSDNNNTQAYIGNVAKKLGVDPTQHLNLNDPEILKGMVNAVIQVENGKNPYSQEMVGRAAGAKPVEINQTTNVTIQGGNLGAGAAVVRAQDGVNERLVRNVKGAAQ